MSKFPVHTLESAPEPSRPLLEKVEKAWSFIPNLHATLAETHEPFMSDPALAWTRNP